MVAAAAVEQVLGVLPKGLVPARQVGLGVGVGAGGGLGLGPLYPNRDPNPNG